MSGKGAVPDSEEIEERKKGLSDDAYAVCFGKSTEPPFTGIYHDCKDPGLYRCVCCGVVLFESSAKFDSGTGWPSFYEPAGDSIRYEKDAAYGMTRTEVLCSVCGAHLGHVFDDGPRPTGLRYCINSASLRLEREQHGKAE